MIFLSKVGTTINKLKRCSIASGNGMYLIFSNDLSTGGRYFNNCVEYVGSFIKTWLEWNRRVIKREQSPRELWHRDRAWNRKRIGLVEEGWMKSMRIRQLEVDGVWLTWIIPSGCLYMINFSYGYEDPTIADVQLPWRHGDIVVVSYRDEPEKTWSRHQLIRQQTFVLSASILSPW